MWSWEPDGGSLLPACLCNCRMDFTTHKGQNECDHLWSSIAHRFFFFWLYDSHRYWSSFFKQGDLLIYILQNYWTLQWGELWGWLDMSHKFFPIFFAYTCAHIHTHSHTCFCSQTSWRLACFVDAGTLYSLSGHLGKFQKKTLSNIWSILVCGIRFLG